MSQRFQLVSLSTALTAVLLFGVTSRAAGEACGAIFDLPPAGTQSARFLWLETDSPARTNWLREQNHQVHASQATSPQRAAVGDWLKNVFASSKDLKIVPIDEQRKLRIVYGGLSKGSELRLETAGQKSEVLFSSLQVAKNFTVTFLNAAVSPNKTKIMMTFARNGSLDNFFHILYDLEKRRVIKSDFTSTGQNPVWATNDTLFFQQWDAVTNDDNVVVMDLKGNIRRNLGSGGITDSKGGWSALASTETGTIAIRANGKSIQIAEKQVTMLIGEANGRLFYGGNTEGTGQIFSRRTDRKSDPADGVVMRGQKDIVAAQIVGEYLIFQTDRGYYHHLEVTDLQGKSIADIKLPDCCSVGGKSWIVPGKRLAVSLTSDVVKNQTFVYDLEAQHFEDSEIQSKMLTLNGQKFVSEVREARSADGTMIPVRLTYLESMPRDRTRQAFVEVYGGFNLGGYFAPKFNRLNLQFMLQGGVVAHPAVRGGNEFGPHWHESAMFENKERTLEDVAATSLLLEERGFAMPKRMILTGTSNGGMVVAATAQKYPDRFGLVIPISGVEDMMHKESIDRRMGEGWSYEYGDSRDPKIAPVMRRYAPVEAAAGPGPRPETFIINGIVDSRVNAVNSFKLHAVLAAVHPGTSQLLSVKNSGHWLASSDYQDVIAWRVNTMMWTKIYDFLGTNFVPKTDGL